MWTQADKMVWMGCGDRLPAGIIPASLQQQDKLPAADGPAHSLHPKSDGPSGALVSVSAVQAAPASHLQSVRMPAAKLADALQVG